MLWKSIYKKRLFYIWLMSYVAILIIPLIITLSSYFYSRDIISNEIEKAGVASLAQAKDVLDNAFMGIENLCSDIEVSTQLTNILYDEQTISNKRKYDLYTFMKIVGTYGASNMYKEQLVFYIKNLDQLLSGSGIISVDTFLKDIVFFDEQQEELFKKYVKTMPSIGFYAIPNQENTDNKLIYLRPMPSNNKTDFKVMAMMLLNESKLEATLKHAQWINGSTVLMLKNQKHPIISVGEPISDEWIQKIKFENNDFMKQQNFNNKDYYIFYQQSEIPNYGYIMFIPKHIFLGKTDLLRNKTIFLIIVASTIGIILSYIFSRKSYLPLQKTLRMLMENGFAENSDKNINQIAIIQTSLSDIIQEMKESRQWISNEKEYLRNSFFRRLLNGKYHSYDKLEEILSLYDVKFSSNNFMVMLLAAEEIEGVIVENRGQIKNAVTFVLNKILNEIISENTEIIHYLVECERYYCVIFSLNKASNDSDNEIIIEKYYNTLTKRAKQVNILLTGTLSSEYIGINNLTLCYREAVSAMEYVMLLNYHKLLTYKNMINKQEHSIQTCYNFEQEQILVNLIRQGDYKRSKQHIENIFNAMKTSQYSLEKIQCTVFSVINTVLNALSRNKLYKENLIDDINPTKRLLSCTNIEEIYDEMQKILTEASHLIKTVDDKDKRIEKICKYIKSNYSNSSFNVSDIAERFNINLSYASTIFHASTGQTILEYMHKIRIKKAKELLINHSFGVNEISKMVGFTNSNSFIRVFKKYEGITPGQYRNLKI